mgnify:CR=1 FL=1
MRTMKSSNPALSVFDKVSHQASATPMTIQGTVNKSILLLLLVILTASLSWSLSMAGNNLAYPLMIVGVIGGLVCALVAIFAINTINITAPLYALFEGLFLGGISAIFASFYKGIVFQAVIITFTVFGVMLLLYKFRIIQATATFTKILVLATASIAVYYLISIVLRLFGIDISVFAMGTMGIVIQGVIVVVAALNFILDFNFIEQGSAQGLPKKMEWYGSFSLLVTLIWLYLEILRLLAILNRR